MEVRQGYKQTEVGIIPEDWNVVSLGLLSLKIGSGITPTGGERVYKNEGRPFLRSQNVGWGRLILNDIVYIDDQTHASFDSTEIKADDVFLNITGASIGRSAIANSFVENGNVNQHVCIIRTDKTKLFSRFLNHFLLSRQGQSQVESFQSSGNRQGLNFGQIRDFKIPIPKSFSEQTAIATALSDTDALITNLEKLIEKKREIKLGAMQELLKPKEGWVVKKLVEIANVTMGQSPLSRYYNNQGIGLPLIQGNADVKDRQTIIRAFTSYITKRGFGGDVIMSVRAPVGEISKTAFDCCLGRGVCAIKSKNDYLYHYLIYFEKSWAKLSTGSTFDSVNSKQVKELEIPIPSHTEQVRISHILTDMDTEISALKEKLSKYKLLKQGMMQELLTGKTRLV